MRQSHNGQTKLLIAAIAVGLFLNAAVHTVKPAHADDETDGRTLGQNATELGDIKYFMRELTEGSCRNKKLC
jgi:hypothetical protein